MSRIIRTVSLDQRTDELAGKKPNFSAWVRNQLILDFQEISMVHTTLESFEFNGICSPSMNPRCSLCYPYGKPTQEMIKKYNSDRFNATHYVLPDNRGTSQYEDHIRRENMKKVVSDLKENCKKHYDGVVVDVKPIIEENSPLAPPRSERKYITRSLKWIWSFI